MALAYSPEGQYISKQAPHFPAQHTELQVSGNLEGGRQNLNDILLMSVQAWVRCGQAREVCDGSTQNQRYSGGRPVYMAAPPLQDDLDSTCNTSMNAVHRLDT